MRGSVGESRPQDACLSSANFELGLRVLASSIKDGPRPSAFDVIQLLGAGYHRDILGQQGERAAAFMADSIWGKQLKELKHPEVKAGMRQQLSLAKAGTLKSASSFTGFGSSLDEEVLPALMCAISRSALGCFKDALAAAAQHAQAAAAEAEEEASPVVQLKVGPIKRPARIAVKVGEYREEKGAEHWPHSSFVTDILRASYICRDARSMVQAFEGLSASPYFQVVRLKNKIGECKGPFNLHVNVVFSPAECEDPILCEVQFYPRDVYHLQHRQHLAYELKRAPSAHDL
jgi:hypothetical protein